MAAVVEWVETRPPGGERCVGVTLCPGEAMWVGFREDGLWAAVVGTDFPEGTTPVEIPA